MELNNSTQLLFFRLIILARLLVYFVPWTYKIFFKMSPSVSHISKITLTGRKIFGRHWQQPRPSLHPGRRFSWWYYHPVHCPDHTHCCQQGCEDCCLCRKVGRCGLWDLPGTSLPHWHQDGIYRCHVHRDFSLLILFTYRWLHKCLNYLGLITSPTCLAYLSFPWYKKRKKDHNVNNDSNIIDIDSIRKKSHQKNKEGEIKWSQQSWQIDSLVGWAFVEPSVCK